jgi:hypothetical protein
MQNDIVATLGIVFLFQATTGPRTAKIFGRKKTRPEILIWDYRFFD